jgi:hypothetical protein
LITHGKTAITVHRIQAISDRFKKGKERDRSEPGMVAERIQAMKDRRAAAQQIGVKSRK